MVIISASLSQQGCGGPDLENEKVGLPEDHLEFIKMVSSYREKYEEAENELQKTQLRVSRRRALIQLSISEKKYQFSNWKGEIVDMGTTGDQKAWLDIRPLGIDNVLLGTWNNDLSDTGTGTLIRSGSFVFNQVTQLSAGSIVYFSAKFYIPMGSASTLLFGDFGDTGDEEDYFEEKSMTENGAMTDPEFLVNFKCVKKVADGPC